MIITTNRTIVALLALTLLMQVAIFLGRYSRPPVTFSSTDVRRAVLDAPADATIDLAGVPIRGKEDATIVLIEFSDYECPFCAQHVKNVAPKLNKEFIDTGKVKHAFLNNPLPSHSNAKFLATVAICAGNQGQYWAMHDILFAERPQTKDNVIALAGDLPINVQRFVTCIEGKESTTRIDIDIKEAKRLELTGTPSFGIGRFNAKGQLEIKKLIIGAQPPSVFVKTLNDVIASSDEQ